MRCVVQMQKSSKKKVGGSSKKKSEFSRSAAVMAKLEDLKSGVLAPAAVPAALPRATHLKL
jgi:hypothetical protein